MEEVKRAEQTKLCDAVSSFLSVMMWASMSSAGVGPICFLQSTVNVNAAVYLAVLEHFLVPSVGQLYGNEGSTFQHDLAPAHKTNSTKRGWLIVASGS